VRGVSGMGQAWGMWQGTYSIDGLFEGLGIVLGLTGEGAETGGAEGGDGELGGGAGGGGLDGGVDAGEVGGGHAEDGGGGSRRSEEDEELHFERLESGLGKEWKCWNELC